MKPSLHTLDRLEVSFDDDHLAGDRYELTPHGRRMATFLTKVASRVVVPALTELERAARPRAPSPTQLVAAWRAYEREVQALINASRVAA